MNYLLTFWQKVKYRWLNFRKWLFCPLARKCNWKWLYNKADCQRYQETQYTWRWVCSNCGGLRSEGQDGAIYEKFVLGEEPVECCSCTISIPTEKVRRTVCIHSGKLPRPFCIHRKQIEFNKGTEPTTKCDKHNFKKSGRREEMCSGSLGMFLSFLREAWLPKNQVGAEEDIMEVLYEFAKRDIKYNDFFMWLCDNKAEHKPLNGKTPYYQFKNSSGKRIFDLSKWDERYWELFDRFIYMHSLFGIIPLPQMFMDRYCDYAFKNNVNGINVKVLSEQALPYCYGLSDRVVDIVQKYFEFVFVKFINEPKHRDDSMFHTIAVWHRRMFDNYKKKFSTQKQALSGVITDNSESEAGQLLLVWHGDKYGQAYNCPKCGKPINQLFPDMLTYSWMDRLRIGEQHSVTMPEDFEKDYNSLESFFGSANRKCRWHEDGASNEEADGYVFGGFRFADAEQYGETCDFVWSQQVARGNRKVNYMVIFACETLLFLDGVFYETWNKDSVNWDRYDEMHKAHIRNFG